MTKEDWQGKKNKKGNSKDKKEKKGTVCL